MGTEQRKWSRKAINAEGFLYACEGWPIGACRIEDVSEDLPEMFCLVLDGLALAKHCRVVWRSHDNIGVTFGCDLSPAAGENA
jgi:hypothetical protein